MWKKLINGVIIFKNILSVFIGFPIVMEVRGKLEMKKIKTKIYPVIIIIISIITGVRKGYSKIIWTLVNFPNMVFVSMIIAESACGIIGLIIYSLIFDNKKLKLYENYKIVDKYMSVKENEYSKYNKLLGTTYVIYFILILVINSYDFYHWAKGSDQFILMWKITMIDIIILQFFEEIGKWNVRLQIFNEKLENLVETKYNSEISIPRDSSNKKTQENTIEINLLIKTYEKIWESINFIGKQFNCVVSMEKQYFQFQIPKKTW